MTRLHQSNSVLRDFATSQGKVAMVNKDTSKCTFRIWALCDWYDSLHISRLVASYMASINVSDKIWLITCENKQILIIHTIIYIY